MDVIAHRKLRLCAQLPRKADFAYLLHANKQAKQAIYPPLGLLEYPSTEAYNQVYRRATNTTTTIANTRLDRPYCTPSTPVGTTSAYEV